MKTVNARDLQKKIKECVDLSQEDQVVITRRGKPAAVMVGVEGKDWEDVLQTSSTFWRFIEERRKEPTMSMKELRTRLKKGNRNEKRRGIWMSSSHAPIGDQSL